MPVNVTEGASLMLVAEDRTLRELVHSIYAGDDESRANHVTTLLADVLRKGDDRSRVALGKFLDLPAVSQKDLDAARLDLALSQQARLLINGANAYRVENWILSYEMSAPGSRHRSLYENILRNFVTSSIAVEVMRRQVAQAYELVSEAHSKCVALQQVIRTRIRG
jgi:hypothetical protein